MDIEIRCVHDQGSFITKPLQHLPLEFYPVYDRFTHRQRVRSSRLTESPYKHLIPCFEVHDVNRKAARHQLFQYILKIRKKFPLSDIYTESNFIYFGAGLGT